VSSPTPPWLDPLPFLISFPIHLFIPFFSLLLNALLLLYMVTLSFWSEFPFPRTILSVLCPWRQTNPFFSSVLSVYLLFLYPPFSWSFVPWKCVLINVPTLFCRKNHDSLPRPHKGFIRFSWIPVAFTFIASVLRRKSPPSASPTASFFFFTIYINTSTRTRCLQNQPILPLPPPLLTLSSHPTHPFTHPPVTQVTSPFRLNDPLRSPPPQPFLPPFFPSYPFAVYLQDNDPFFPLGILQLFSSLFPPHAS